MRRFLLAFPFLLSLVAAHPAAGLPANTTGIPLKLPPGFSISIYARTPGFPRVMVLDPSGNLVVSLTQQGKVIAILHNNPKRIVTLADGLNLPHGLAFRCRQGCKLYVAESNQVDSFDYDSKRLKLSRKRKIVDLPNDGMHFTRTLLFMPPPDQDKLLISVGSDCNVCHEKEWRRAKILVCGPNGENLKPFASGLRNAVFMAVHPVTHEIWATDMGRDWLGDNLPPDTIDIVKQGDDFGWPLCYGKNVHDTNFDRRKLAADPCKGKTPSTIDIQAHSAPLGLAFFPSRGWPDSFIHDLLVAYHGSWNRSVPTGYEVVRFNLDLKGDYLGSEDFISGWLRPDGSVLGRPVGIAIREDGTIFISDDKAGFIYEVKYRGQGNATPRRE